VGAQLNADQILHVKRRLFKGFGGIAQLVETASLNWNQRLSQTTLPSGTRGGRRGTLTPIAIDV
jgi:hypothetical protein